MIQRIQSVYLLLGALCVLALLFVDGLWTSPAAETLSWFGPAVLGIGAVVVFVAVASIFLYKNRSRQRSVIVALQGITLVFVLVLYAGLYLTGMLASLTASSAAVSLVLILLLPVLAYVCFFLARRGVEKDIALVRSMDRLR